MDIVADMKQIIKNKQMDKTISFKAINGMTVSTQVNKVTGFGQLLQDGSYLTVNTSKGSFPVHPADRRRVWNSFMPFEEGGQA